MEQEYEYVLNERQMNMNQLKLLHDGYNEKYRYKHFQKLQQDIVHFELTSKHFEKANCEEGIAKDAKIMRTNLIYEAHEAQLYEGVINEEHCYVKVDLKENFVKKYHVKSLENHIKLMLHIKNPDKFIQLIKAYAIQNKVYLFISANKSLGRLSGKSK